MSRCLRKALRAHKFAPVITYFTMRYSTYKTSTSFQHFTQCRWHPGTSDAGATLPGARMRSIAPRSRALCAAPTAVAADAADRQRINGCQ
eukprot:2379664-Prymnesium_polylepis.1